jgi:gliding motility-associated-like protein
MRLILLLFLFINFNLYSQNQTIELCEDSNNTFTYNSIGSPDCEYYWEIKLNNWPIFSFTGKEMTYTFKDVGDYKIILFSENTLSCRSEPEIYDVKVINCRIPIITIPNAFTPNSNNLNDIWQPISSYMAEIKIFVYNKWGGLVFATENFNDFWDGKLNGDDCPSGVYVYYVEYKTIKGFNGYKRGTVTLYR